MHVGQGHLFQNLGSERPDADVWRAETTLADRAEGLGFDSVWAVEHHFADYSFSADPTQFLTWVAARSERIRLGSMVCVLPWHDPVRIAESVSVLDQLSGGRFVLGMGRGLARLEFEGFDVPMEHSRELFVENAELLLEAFETGAVRGAEIRPRPTLPLRGRTYATAISPDSAEIMARLGAGIMIFLQKPWEQTVGDLERYADHYRRINGSEPPKPLVVIMNACDHDRGRAEEHYQEIIEYYRSTIDHYEFADAAHATIPGYEYYGNIAKTIEKHGRDNFARFLADLQPWGTPAEVAEQTIETVRRTDAAGVIVMSAYGRVPDDRARAAQQLFAEEVLPVLKAVDTGPDIGLAQHALNAR